MVFVYKIYNMYQLQNINIEINKANSDISRCGLLENTQ